MFWRGAGKEKPLYKRPSREAAGAPQHADTPGDNRRQLPRFGRSNHAPSSATRRSRANCSERRNDGLYHPPLLSPHASSRSPSSPSPADTEQGLPPPARPGEPPATLPPPRLPPSRSQPLSQCRPRRGRSQPEKAETEPHAARPPASSAASPRSPSQVPVPAPPPAAAEAAPSAPPPAEETRRGRHFRRDGTALPDGTCSEEGGRERNGTGVGPSPPAASAFLRQRQPELP